MKKQRKLKVKGLLAIIGGGMIVTGLVLFIVAIAANGGSSEGFGAADYTTEEYTVEGSFESIYVTSDDADVYFAKSTDGKCKIVYNGRDNRKFETSVEDGTLNITPDDSGKWYDYAGMTYKTQNIKIYLPESSYNTVVVVTTSGDVEIPKDFSLQTVRVSTDSGDVTLSASAAVLTDIDCASGTVNINSVVSDSVCIDTDSGECWLNNISCTYISWESASGNLNIYNVKATGQVDIKSTSGFVTFDVLEGLRVYITTESGDVNGSFVTSKAVKASSKSGSVDVPEYLDGNVCEITSDSGDIHVWW